jgi:hypothetical protein
MTNETRSSSSLPLSSSFFLAGDAGGPRADAGTALAAAVAAYEPTRPVRAALSRRRWRLQSRRCRRRPCRRCPRACSPRPCPCRPREGPLESEEKGRRRARQREGMEQRMFLHARGRGWSGGDCRSGGGHRSGRSSCERVWKPQDGGRGCWANRNGSSGRI